MTGASEPRGTPRGFDLLLCHLSSHVHHDFAASESAHIYLIMKHLSTRRKGGFDRCLLLSLCCSCVAHDLANVAHDSAGCCSRLNSCYCCKAVEACVAWASWALSHRLITPSDLHPTMAPNTEPRKARSSSAEEHSGTEGVCSVLSDRHCTRPTRPALPCIPSVH